MFGLMKYYRCASSQEERDRYRQHYCGVCKSLGRLYGQHTRFLLNRDLVFLSEVLTELSSQRFPTEAPWSRPLSRINNCLKLPRRRDDVPLSLQVAATYNVLMSRFKLEDNIADARRARSWLWKSLKFGMSRAFGTSSQQAEAWDYPLDGVSWWMEAQRQRESDQSPPKDPEQALDYFAEPSAHTSGLSMQQAAIIIDRPDRANQMYRLGYHFGKLIYLIDALEDADEDYDKRQFNAIRSAYRLAEKELPADCLQVVHALCRKLAKDSQEAISALQLSERKEDQFKRRLARNLTRKLDREHCSPRTKCDSAGQQLKKMKLREKWYYAKELSLKLAFSQTAASPVALSKASLTFLALFACIFSTPQQVLGYVTAQLETSIGNGSSDCLSLMFFISWTGLALGAAFRRPKTLKLTKRSFENLKENGVPEEILDSLQDMRGREFSTQDEFLQAIHKRIGEQTVPYQSKFLQYAARPKRKSHNVDGSDDTSGGCDYCDCCYCGDCCDCCSCLPDSCGSSGSGVDAAGGSNCDCGSADGCDFGSCCECGSCGDSCSGCDCGGCDCGGCDCDCGC